MANPNGPFSESGLSQHDPSAPVLWMGRPIGEPSMTDPSDRTNCYPKSGTHAWQAFAGLALELGGYQDVEVCDPYSGRRLWVPIPDSLKEAGVIAWYQYALTVAAEYDWSREGDGGLVENPPAPLPAIKPVGMGGADRHR